MLHLDCAMLLRQGLLQVRDEVIMAKVKEIELRALNAEQELQGVASGVHDLDAQITAAHSALISRRESKGDSSFQNGDKHLSSTQKSSRIHLIFPQHADISESAQST